MIIDCNLIDCDGDRGDLGDDLMTLLMIKDHVFHSSSFADLLILLFLKKKSLDPDFMTFKSDT